MTITKQRTNPAAYSVAVDGVEFVAVFKTLHNNTNGHPRREVAIAWNDPRGFSGMCCRLFLIVLNYETEEEAAEQLARRIVDSWKK
jgi:hypothetical protein